MCSCDRQLLYEAHKSTQGTLSTSDNERRYLTELQCCSTWERSMAYGCVPPTNSDPRDAWMPSNYAFTCGSILPPIELLFMGGKTQSTLHNQNRTGSSHNIFHRLLCRTNIRNSTRRVAAIWIMACILSEVFFLAPASCLSAPGENSPAQATKSDFATQSTSCLESCICIYGKDNHRIMKALMKNNGQIEEWIRIRDSASIAPVTTVICSGSGFASVPTGITISVDVLILDDNSINALNALDLFPNENSTNLMSPAVVLSFSQNKISFISPGAFKGVPDLKILILRNNSIGNLKWTVSAASNLRRLVEMDLSYNQIRRLTETEIGFFPALSRLDLSNNFLEFVESEALSNFPSLEFWDLSSNQLTQKSFQSSAVLLPMLNHISLSDNRIKDPKLLISRFPNLFANLHTLDYSRNRVASGHVDSEAFYGMQKLKLLNMSHCDIYILAQGWLNGGPHQSLEELDISHNSFPAISAYALSAVFTADLNFTPPRQANHNSQEFEVTTIKVPTISSVDFDFNQVPTEKVEMKWLRPLKQLKTLHLNDNPRLQTIEADAFDYLPKLRHLFLQNCRIERMKIASARYRYSSDAVANTLPELSKIWIYGNPLQCDCYVRMLKQWTFTGNKVPGTQLKVTRTIDSTFYTTDNDTKTINVDVAQCASPASFAGLVLATAPEASMTCQEEPYSILIAMLIGPLTFAASILLTLLCGSIHVCLVKMKRGVVLSYHAREGVLRKRGTKRRRTPQPDPIFSNFAWNRPTPTEDAPRGLHPAYTNIVLGQLSSKHEERTRSRNTGNYLMSPRMTAASSITSLDCTDYHTRNRQSAGYCSGSENVRPNESITPLLVVSAPVNNTHNLTVEESGSDADSVIERESIRTRSASSDIPYINEKGRKMACTTNRQDRVVRLHKKSSSSGSEGLLLACQSKSKASSRPTSVSTLSVNARLEASNGTRRRDSRHLSASIGDISPSNGRALPSSGGFDFEEETCL